MPTTFLIVDTTKRLGGQMRSAVDQLRDVRDRLRKLKEVMDTQVDLTPDPDDYSLLEAQFGIATGKGQEAYNLVAGAFAAVNVTAVLQLLERCG
jgi:hypothetical protein